MMLPCSHSESVTNQVQPTIELLSNLDNLHPDVLLQHSIQPTDYKNSLVFRSAVESIRGTFIASSTTGREGLINGVFVNLQNAGKITSFEHSSNTGRFDFTILISRDTNYSAALEVKGGEGNSINISDRPLWASEFGIWCHLDGAIVNQPSHGAHSIINRVTNELVRRKKLVDVVFFKDNLCGTHLRPCPKYTGREATIGLNTAPDVFLFPQRIPTIEDPEPPAHTLDMLQLPTLILDSFGVTPEERNTHIWEVVVKLEELGSHKYRRAIAIKHDGEIIEQSFSRSWKD